jgi:DNA polymerase-3 subunit delta'
MTEQRNPQARESIPALGEIRGQPSAIALLRQGLTRGALHHALLFVGPEGVGKRTTALALARHLVCLERIDEACGRCAACVQVAAGSHSDVRTVGLFFDDKRKELREHTLIEQVREVQLFLAGRAFGRGRKVVLFEEAHALTEDAQNALLKTLEEPPRGSLIVLVCHNASRLLPTVRSRCQRVTFVPLEPAVVESVLEARFATSVEDARFLALHSDGSLAFAADPSALREAHEAALEMVVAARSRSYAEIVTAVRETFAGSRSVPLELKMLLSVLRRELRARAGLEAGELTPAAKTGTLVGALHAVEAAYAAVVDLGRNANRSLTAERMALRIGATLDS